MRYGKPVGVANLLLIGALLAGCSTKDTQTITDDTKKLAQSTQSAVQNSTLSHRVNIVITAWKDLDGSGVKVESDGGTVTLNGTVKSERDHKRIVAMVKRMQGVEKCVDAIKVTP